MACVLYGLPQGCCCGECPTKAETGLPDSLRVAFSVLSSDSTGMPADQDIGDCDGDNIYAHFTHDSALVELLSDIVFDYVESATTTSCGCCCFRYEGRTDYTPECPVSAPDGILLGPSPFPPSPIDGIVSQTRWTGSHLGTTTGGPTTPDCCPNYDTLPVCADVCGDYDIVESDQDAAGNAHCTASLTICVEGSVVTICLSIEITIECKTHTADGTYIFPYDIPGSDDPACTQDWPGGWWLGSSITNEACATSTTSSLYLTATADLSGVAGADIWAKIKAAPTWESDYETAHCNCGSGGCLDEYRYQICGCVVGPETCICTETDPNDSEALCEPTIEETGYPYNRECLYAVGEIGMAFADE